MERREFLKISEEANLVKEAEERRIISDGSQDPFVSITEGCVQVMTLICCE